MSFASWFCKHSWELKHSVDRERTWEDGKKEGFTLLLYFCKRCGKIKKVEMK